MRYEKAIEIINDPEFMLAYGSFMMKVDSVELTEEDRKFLSGFNLLFLVYDLAKRAQSLAPESKFCLMVYILSEDFENPEFDKDIERLSKFTRDEVFLLYKDTEEKISKVINGKLARFLRDRIPIKFKGIVWAMFFPELTENNALFLPLN